jgi:hypothetical protein
VIGGALRLDPAAFETVLERPDGLTVAITLLVLAGLSQALGQSVALFANRVRPWRFALSLLLGAALFALSVLLWGVMLDVASRLGFGRAASLERVAEVVGLAHAPRLFGVLVLTPYFGTAIAAALTIWTLLALTVGARVAFGVGLVEALALLGVAWLASEATSRTIGRPVARAVAAVRRWVAGATSEPSRRGPPRDGPEAP